MDRRLGAGDRKQETGKIDGIKTGVRKYRKDRRDG
jgi:hypothetical protein